MEEIPQVQKTPNEAINASFEALLQETRGGNLHGFILVSRFSDHYKVKLADPWNKAQGTTGMVGTGQDMMAMTYEVLFAITDGLSPADRLNVAFIALAGALHEKMPIMVFPPAAPNKI